MPAEVNIRCFSVLSYANGFTLWHYKASTTGQSREEVDRPGFFDKIADMVNKGDMVLISFADSGALRFVAGAELPVSLVPLT